MCENENSDSSKAGWRVESSFLSAFYSGCKPDELLYMEK